MLRESRLRLVLIASATVISLAVACSSDEESAPAPPPPPPPPAAAAPPPAPPPSQTEAKLSPQQYDAPPPLTIDTSKSYTAIFELEKGAQFTVQLFAAEVPSLDLWKQSNDAQLIAKADAHWKKVSR